MAQIYLIQNNVNGKMYIGFTKSNVNERFKRHSIDAKRSNTPFHRAIVKYGPKSFTLCVLEEHHDALFLHRERESYWITQYKDKDLYNCQPGGEGNMGHGSPVFLYDGANLMEEFDGPTSCAAFLGVPFHKVSHALDRQRLGKASGINVGDMYYTVTRDKDVVRSHVRFDNKKIISASDGRVFESAFDAARELGVSSQRVRYAAKHKQRVAGIKLTMGT